MRKAENSTTKNQRQTENFDSLSKFWWDENDKSYKVLREINKIRVEYLKEKVLEHFDISSTQSLEVIDVGCGGGILASSLANDFNKITAIDASLLSIEEAKLYASKHGITNINYINTTPEEFVLQNKNVKFDIVVSFEVLEHVDNLDLFVKSCTDLVKDDGIILFSTINKNIKSYLLAIFLAENVLRWIPKGMHVYENLIKPSEINNILEKYSFKISEMKGLSFNVFSRKWIISDDIDVNYFMKVVKS
jgi:2-polyprenyl-6-hydroxyphenyl methylase / 3-demethylubiquinone-9 3-methyltransferase